MQICQPPSLRLAVVSAAFLDDFTFFFFVMKMTPELATLFLVLVALGFFYSSNHLLLFFVFFRLVGIGKYNAILLWVYVPRLETSRNFFLFFQAPWL